MMTVDRQLEIGFIGLGVMGGPMAMNLLKAGYKLHVHDLDLAKVSVLQAAGAQAQSDVKRIAAQSDIVMTSLPAPPNVRSVAFGGHGLMENMRPGAIWLELSTNSLEVSHELQAAAIVRGINLLDAPVSGGSEGAQAGTLMVLVGGDKRVFERALPVLEVIGGQIDHLGPAGAGYAAKIAQVILCYVHSLALSEALMLGVRGGVDATKMLRIIQNSTGASYVADRYGPCILDGAYDPSFSLGLAHKDLRLAGELASSVGAELPLCDLVKARYAEACNRFGHDANHVMAVKLLEDAHSTYLRSPEES